MIIFESSIVIIFSGHIGMLLDCEKRTVVKRCIDVDIELLPNNRLHGCFKFDGDGFASIDTDKPADPTISK